MATLTLAAAAIAATASPADPPLEVGSLIATSSGGTYRVTSFDLGPGGVPYVWLQRVEMPRGVLHVPASSLANAAPCSTR